MLQVLHTHTYIHTHTHTSVIVPEVFTYVEDNSVLAILYYVHSAYRGAQVGSTPPPFYSDFKYWMLVCALM